MIDQALPHRLVTLIQREREVRITDAARALKLDEKSVMDVAKILSEPKILEIFYAVSGDIILRQGKEFKRAVADKERFEGVSFNERKVDTTPTEGQHSVSDFLDLVRRRTDDKKRGLSQERTAS